MPKELALKTIEAALETIKEKNCSTIIHSDRGSQFSCKDYKNFC